MIRKIIDSKRQRKNSGRLPAVSEPRRVERPRIGVLRTLSEKAPDPQVKALFEQAISDLRKAGAIIVDSVVVPDFDTLRANQDAQFFSTISTRILFPWEKGLL